jgi:hypothetical protein
LNALEIGAAGRKASANLFPVTPERALRLQTPARDRR